MPPSLNAASLAQSPLAAARPVKAAQAPQAQGNRRLAVRALNDTFEPNLGLRPEARPQLQTMALGAEKLNFGEILGKVRAVIIKVVLGAETGAFKSREELVDPDPRWADPGEMKLAKEALAAKKGQEEAAIAALGAARAEQYRKLATLCDGDVPARAALMAMLLDGRMAKQDLKGQGDLLTHLDRVASQPLASGVDRKELLTNLIEECENPTKLQQEGKGTCVATSMTIILTRKSPAEYARLVADLASPAGKATTVTGKALERDPDWANENDYGRTPSLRLLQPALMELGNGWRRYDNAKDVHRAFEVGPEETGFLASVKRFLGKLPLGGGQGSFGATKIVENITGDDYSTIAIVGWPNRGSAWSRVKESLAQGHAVPVGLMWEGGGHEIVLDKVEGGWAYYSNPWGIQERMKEAEFKQRLNNVSLFRG